MRTEASTTKADLRAELARTDAMALDLWNREGQAIEAIQEALAELSEGVHLPNDGGDTVSVSVPIANWREAIMHLRSVLPPHPAST